MKSTFKNLTDLSALQQQLKQREQQQKIAEQQRQEALRIQQQHANAFKNAIGDVKPIKANDKVFHQAPVLPQTTQNEARKKNHAPINSMQQAMAAMDAGEQWSDEFEQARWHDKDGAHAHSQQASSYIASGNSPDILEKLRKGQWQIQAFLDLHGYQREQARSALADFIRRAKQAKLRAVCIIHGKGINSPQGAVLPNKVRIWLSQSNDVQAFCSAAEKDGGVGATQVLLVATKREDVY